MNVHEKYEITTSTASITSTLRGQSEEQLWYPWVVNIYSDIYIYIYIAGQAVAFHDIILMPKSSGLCPGHEEADVYLRKAFGFEIDQWAYTKHTLHTFSVFCLAKVQLRSDKMCFYCTWDMLDHFFGSAVTARKKMKRVSCDGRTFRQPKFRPGKGAE